MQKLEALKRRTWEILQDAEPGDTASSVFDICLISLVSLNVLAVVLESVPEISSRYGEVFRCFEIFSVMVFSIEYLARVWSCVLSDRFSSPILGRLRYAFTPLALIDFFAVIPFFLPFIWADLRSIRALRLLRLLRILKIGHYSESIRLFGDVFREKKDELLASCFIAILLLVIASTFMFYAEHHAQPEEFADIPSTMWWAMATLTTIGYGDVVPVTATGRLIASLVAVLGIGFIALPTGILGSGFVDQLAQRRESKNRSCPHCGKNISN